MPECNKSKRFVIHKHQAKRAGLHYDIRFTYKYSDKKDCVLLSFATRKWIDFFEKKVSRILLFRQEDHGLDWLDFEGVIPSGLYGHGSLEIWDTGTISFEKDEFETRGLLIVTFNGQKLKDTLVFLHMKDNEYLLFRKKK